MRGKTESVLLASAFFLAACGGGGGDDGPSLGSSATFSGTVAIGEPLSGASIVVVHESGAAAFATTDAAGRYSVTLSSLPRGFRPLFMLQTHDPVSGVLSAPPAYPRLFSVANRTSGTVNITPLTSLQVASLLGLKQGFFTDLAAMRSMPTPSSSDLATARQGVVDYLLNNRPQPNNGNTTVSVDASAVADFIGTAFNAVAGNPHDDAIEAVAQTLMAGETIEGVEEHMLARLDGPADLTAVLSLNFVANCVAQGNPSGFPTGAVNVSFNLNGQIIVGGYGYILATGDGVRRINSPLDELWRFEFATGDQLQITQSGTRLNSFSLSNLGGGVLCTPSTALPLGAKIPSLLAQVRKLASNITNATISCPAGVPNFPGVDGAANLQIQTNGALRLNTGHALHLPSLGLEISADITNNSGILTTQVRTAAFSRTFMGGFDSFTVTLNAAGDIQTASFGQQRNGGTSLSRSCT